MEKKKGFPGSLLCIVNISESPAVAVGIGLLKKIFLYFGHFNIFVDRGDACGGAGGQKKSRD